MLGYSTNMLRYSAEILRYPPYMLMNQRSTVYWDGFIAYTSFNYPWNLRILHLKVASFFHYPWYHMFSYSVGKNDLKHVLKSKRAYLQKGVFSIPGVKSMLHPRASWLQSTLKINFLPMISLFSRNRGKKKNRLPSYIQIPNIRGNNNLYFIVLLTLDCIHKEYPQICYYFYWIYRICQISKRLSNYSQIRNDKHLCF